MTALPTNQLRPKRERNDPYEALKELAFRFFLSGRLFMTMGVQIVYVVINWEIVRITNDPKMVGYMGLIEAAPALLVALYAGYIADKRDRRKMVIVCQLVLWSSIVGLYLFMQLGHNMLEAGNGITIVFMLLFCIGLSRGLLVPALFGLMGEIVPPKAYGNASTWNSSVWHTAVIVGPAVGAGAYVSLGVNNSYLLAAVFITLSMLSFIVIPRHRIGKRKVQQSREGITDSILTGLRFVFRKQVILTAITLDLFAVLFGGAVALLPFFAGKGFLDVGPHGFAVLRAAPAVGAVVMAALLVYFPVRRAAGKIMLWSVAGFGLCMIGFALSKVFALSVALLFLSGMFDNISVVIRSTILQLYTPDNMRGRVSAVNSIFVGSSNELGAFESGMMADQLGIVRSVVFGGIMTLVVVVLAAIQAPVLVNLNLNDAPALDKEEEENDRPVQ